MLCFVGYPPHRLATPTHQEIRDTFSSCESPAKRLKAENPADTVDDQLVRAMVSYKKS